MKNDKGAVTILAITTVLFFVLLLGSAYAIAASKLQSEIEITKKTSQIYEGSEEEAYNSFYKEGGIPIYTPEQFLKIGSSQNLPVSEEGGTIYNFTPDANYIIKNDLEFEYNGIVNINLDASR